MGMSEIKIRKHVFLPPDLLREVTDKRFAGRFASEADTIARLIAAGIDSQNGNGYVYLAEGGRGGLLKIGHSRNPKQRMADLSSVEKQPVSMVCALAGGRDLEFTAHVVWGEFRVRGEWFADDPGIRQWFMVHPCFVGTDISGKSIRIPVTLTEDQHEKLTAAAEALGLTISAYIRAAALREAGRDG